MDPVLYPMKMHNSLLIIPGFGGTLGLSRKLRQVLSEDFIIHDIELADYSKNATLAGSPTVRKFASWIETNHKSLPRQPDQIIVGSCMGSMLAIEMAFIMKKRGFPPRQLILIDPPVRLPYMLYKNKIFLFYKSIRAYLGSLKKIYKAREWLKQRENPFIYRMRLSSRVKVFFRFKPPCPTSIILSSERSHLRENGQFSVTFKDANYYIIDDIHRELFHNTANLSRIGEIINREVLHPNAASSE